jgi:drug/metabolite transporter (DMT)-like permease
MTWLLYIANAALARTESALGKYSGRRGGNPHTFNLGKTVAAAVLCVLLALIVGFEYHTDTLILALIYGGTLALSMHAGFMALSLGNMAIVSMIASFSLIIPVFWGLAFLNETVTVFGIIGLVLIAASLVLLNIKKGGGRLSLKCWIYALITMLANGITSVVQKYHQSENPGLYKVEFMLISMAFACLIFIFIWIKEMILKKQAVTNVEKANDTPTCFFKNITHNFALMLGLLSGVMNCLANYSILFLANGENASVLFPILSAMNAIGACLIGRFIFKERLTPLQLVSICLGIASVVLLKL